MKLGSLLLSASMALTVSTTALADDGFATLKGIESAPMSSQELSAVKGQHFHFVNASGKLHLVNIKQGARFANENAGDNPAGGLTPNFDIAPDLTPVGKGYRGLCVSHSVGGIFIPGNIAAQCAP